MEATIKFSWVTDDLFDHPQELNPDLALHAARLIAEGLGKGYDDGQMHAKFAAVVKEGYLVCIHYYVHNGISKTYSDIARVGYDGKFVAFS